MLSLVPVMKKQQVLNCSFSAWYPIFKHITIDSHILPLSKEFLAYLDADGIYLPKSPTDAPSDIIDDTEEIDHNKTPSFPDLEASIKESIQSLGGRVFPKLNWSSPRDASWMARGNTLRCSRVNDVLLLLKSSDFVSHDLSLPFEHCTDCEDGQKNNVKYELILRRWTDISEATEFRVFVKNDNIIGISQRDHTNFFPDLIPLADDINLEIEDFHDRHIAGNFPDHDYVYDIYRQDKRKFLLIDFNPFGEVTDPLLFNWTDLNQLDVTSPESQSWETFRIVRSFEGIQPSQYLSYRIPMDILHLTTGMDANKLADFLRMEMQMPDQQESSSSDDEDASPVDEDQPEK
ncbi:cell division cycle protein 123 homolog [Asterias rubens]|uniref:cell division cycle protein 123 homolog n=1 Tax=Asterias rubens TaxID=7604 RepID=UPI0014551B79|nr:cell division cycle protein 123 homolog [Asterias rubens]XP_033647871.1 cell division cycle protein 123 homolog [Asterias rubens]